MRRSRGACGLLGYAGPRRTDGDRSDVSCYRLRSGRRALERRCTATGEGPKRPTSPLTFSNAPPLATSRLAQLALTLDHSSRSAQLRARRGATASTSRRVRSARGGPDAADVAQRAASLSFPRTLPLAHRARMVQRKLQLPGERCAGELKTLLSSSPSRFLSSRPSRARKVSESVQPASPLARDDSLKHASELQVPHRPDYKTACCRETSPPARDLVKRSAPILHARLRPACPTARHQPSLSLSFALGFPSSTNCSIFSLHSLIWSSMPTASTASPESAMPLRLAAWMSP